MKHNSILVRYFLCFLTAACCFLFSVKSAHAQQKPAFRKFGIGVYGGPQLFGQIIKGLEFGGVSGFTAGADLRFSFGESAQGLSLHIQPGYNTFRQRMSAGENTQFEYHYDWQWQAIQVPVLFRHTFLPGKIRPFVEAGPTLRLRTAFKVRESGYACGIAGCNSFDRNYDIQSELRQDVIALTAGAGVEFDLGRITIPVSVRIQEGIGTYRSKDKLLDASYYEGMKTRVLQVTAGVAF